MSVALSRGNLPSAGRPDRHVLASVLQTLVALVLVVGVALLIGFRPSTGPLEWLAAAGLLRLTALALRYLWARKLCDRDPARWMSDNRSSRSRTDLTGGA